MASKNKKLSSAASIFDQTLEGTIRKISLSEIVPSEDQPRQDKDTNIQALAQSLKEEGLLQPIVVKKEGINFKIIAGERRFRAASINGWKEIECRILKKDPRETFKLAVVENIQRENLGAFDESHAFSKLKNLYSYTDKELSDIVGKSRNYITELLSIADIPDTWRLKSAEAGITNKNLLVQLAMAIKLNIAEEFIRQFKAGIINSVKTAKAFIQNHKQSDMPSSAKQIHGSTPKPWFSVKVAIQSNSNRSFAFSTEIDGLHTALKNPEKVLKKIQKASEKIIQQELGSSNTAQ